MSKPRTPSPEPANLVTKRGCFVWLILIAFLGALAAVLTDWWWLLLLALPVLAATGHWFQGKLLLYRAARAYAPCGIRGVLVTSDSPHWKTYIEQHWLPRFRDQFVVLNFSQRKRWEPSFATRLFERFCYGPDYKNHCPAVILLRGSQHPLVFRFFYAFRDHKHGNPAALRLLERRLFEELDALPGKEKTRR